MNLDALLAFCFWIYLGFIGVVFWLQRRRWRARRRKGLTGFRPSTFLLGNALHQLQTISQPSVEYVLEEKLKEDVEDDEPGGPDDPVRHLHRQARRIRRGERLDRLTVLLAKRR